MIWTKWQREGLDLAVAAKGEGLPCFFQHGLCGAASQTEEIFPCDIGWQLLTLECRGHGSSPGGPADRYSINVFADDLTNLIEHRFERPVAIGGISMGAAIAMRIAATRPDLVSALILARPAWLVERAPANMLPNAMVGELLTQYEPREARLIFEQSDTARQLAIDAPDNLASILTFFTREPISVTRELLRRIARDGPGLDEEDLTSLDVPTLIIWNSQDVIHPERLARKAGELIPRSSLFEITSKSSSKARYVIEFQAVMSSFLRSIN